MRKLRFSINSEEIWNSDLSAKKRHFVKQEGFKAKFSKDLFGNYFSLKGRLFNVGHTVKGKNGHIFFQNLYLFPYYIFG